MYELRFLIEEFSRRDQEPLRRFLLRRMENLRREEERTEVLRFLEDELARPIPSIPEAVKLASVKLSATALRSRFGGAAPRGDWSVLLSSSSMPREESEKLDPERMAALILRAEELLQPVIGAVTATLDRDLKRSGSVLYGLSTLPFTSLDPLFAEQIKSTHAVPAVWALTRRRPTGDEHYRLLAAIRAQQDGPGGQELLRLLAYLPSTESAEIVLKLAVSGREPLEQGAAMALEGFAAHGFFEIAQALAAKDSVFTQLQLVESLAQIKSEEGHSILRRVYKKATNEFVRYHSMRAAAAIGGSEARALLVEGLKSSSGSVQAVALEGLVTTNLAEGFGQRFVKTFKSSQNPHMLLTSHLCSLYLDREQGFADFMALLARPDEGAQKVALYGLRYIKGEPVSKALAAFTEPGTSPALTILALEAFARQRGDLKALAVIHPLFRSESGTVRARAIRSASAVVAGTEKALELLLQIQEMLKLELEPPVRVEMVRALALLGQGSQGEIGSTLAEIAATDEDIQVKKEAILAGELLGDLPERFLSVLSMNVNPEIQGALARTLWCHGNGEGLRILESMLTDGSRPKREAAFKVLEVIGHELDLLPDCPGLVRLARRLKPLSLPRREVKKPESPAAKRPDSPATRSTPNIAQILEVQPVRIERTAQVPPVIPATPRGEAVGPNTMKLGPMLMKLSTEATPDRSVPWGRIFILGFLAFLFFVLFIGQFK